MKNELIFYSNKPIFLKEFGVNIHQPTISEIAYISEEVFLTGCQILMFDKSNLYLENEDEKAIEYLNQFSDFELYLIVVSQEGSEEALEGLIKFLQLYFIGYEIEIKKNPNYHLEIKNDKEIIIIDRDNFTYLKDILYKINCLDKQSEESKYNPQDAMARRIAEKLKKRHKQLNNQKDEDSIFGKYASILAVGESKDLNILMEYTIFQLTTEFERYIKKVAFDAHNSALLAGAQDLDDVDNWME